MIRPKTGILIVNLGTPDSPEPKDVYKYLQEFLLDPRVIDIAPISRNLLVRGIIVPFRHKKSAKLYKKLWTPEGSPLKVYGHKVEQMLQEEMGPDFKVVLAMRYQSPSIESGLNELIKAGVDRILVFPMFPQYASASTGSVHDKVLEIVSKYQIVPELHLVHSYPEHPGMIKVFADNARQFNLEDYDHFLLSFHGIPQRQMRKASIDNHCLQSENCCQQVCDANRFCYSAQCYRTARALAKELGIPEEKYTVCFQSRLGNDPWIQPYTSDVIKERYNAGDRKMLVFCPAFVSDCLETTVEISDEYHEEFTALGGEKLDLVPSLNDHPEWVKAMKGIIFEHLPGWLKQ